MNMFFQSQDVQHVLYLVLFMATFTSSELCEAMTGHKKVVFANIFDTHNKLVLYCVSYSILCIILNIIFYIVYHILYCVSY